MKWTGKEERINGIWYPVTVEADSLKEQTASSIKDSVRVMGLWKKSGGGL